MLIAIGPLVMVESMATWILSKLHVRKVEGIVVLEILEDHRRAQDNTLPTLKGRLVAVVHVPPNCNQHRMARLCGRQPPQLALRVQGICALRHRDVDIPTVRRSGEAMRGHRLDLALLQWHVRDQGVEHKVLGM